MLGDCRIDISIEDGVSTYTGTNASAYTGIDPSVDPDTNSGAYAGTCASAYTSFGANIDDHINPGAYGDNTPESVMQQYDVEQHGGEE